MGGGGGHLDQGGKYAARLNIRMFQPLLVTFSPERLHCSIIPQSDVNERLVLRYNEGWGGSSKTVLNLNKID